MEPETEGEATAATMTLDQLAALTGREVGVSGWLTVTQDMIDGFAELTGDRQYIHVDPARAAETAFGGTVAHGFLTLSLLSRFAYEARPRLAGTAMSVNYGFDRLRFVAPVPSESRVRARFRLTGLETTAPGEVTFSWQATVEIEGAGRPALVADWITRAYITRAYLEDS